MRLIVEVSEGGTTFVYLETEKHFKKTHRAAGRRDGFVERTNLNEDCCVYPGECVVVTVDGRNCLSRK